jgi:biotin synthase
MIKMSLTKWEALATRVLDGEKLPKEEALTILTAPDSEILAVLHGAYLIREHYFGNEVRLNLLINAKSGRCSEDCGYCSQSVISESNIDKYPLVDKQTLLMGAAKAYSLGVGTYCIVTSGKKPTEKELACLIEAIVEIKAKYPLKICLSIGQVTEEQAQRIKAAGVDRFNHNLNTSQRYTSHIVSTHTYEDRIKNVRIIKTAGIESCSGCIVGMGETDDDLYDIACALRDLKVEAIPINFLHPVQGTPLEGMNQLNPLRCLKVLAFFRFMCPNAEIRMAGGRERNLKSLQPLGLFAANSIFLNGYLTTSGQSPEADYAMLEDLGFKVVPQD